MTLSQEGLTNPNSSSNPEAVEQLETLLSLLTDLQLAQQAEADRANSSSSHEPISGLLAPSGASSEPKPTIVESPNSELHQIEIFPAQLSEKEEEITHPVILETHENLSEKEEDLTLEALSETLASQPLEETDKESDSPALFPQQENESSESLPDRTVTNSLNILNQLLTSSSPAPASLKPQITPPPAERLSHPLSNTDLERVRQELEYLANKIETLEQQVYEPTELINPILPLITELLRLKSTASREDIARALTPIIDEVIAQRSQQDRRAMSAAIATLIPAAISQQIQDSPAEIAKAIAPEIAVAIEEQIRLERDSISKALAPEMGKAIKAQIALERDAMVDALYPVIGNTIAKYMAEVVQSINQQVETALSPEGIKRKVRARMLGVSEAELILQEALPFTVEAIFLIHKASGLLITEVQPSEERRLDSDMIAGMLTAIRSFVNDCIAQSEDVLELNEIEYGNSRIMLEVAGYCYLAVAVKGDPPKKYIDQLRQTLSTIVQQYDRQIQDYDGDPTQIPQPVSTLLETLLQDFSEPKEAKRPTALLVLLAVVLSIGLIPWGIWQYRDRLNRQVEAKTALALASAPELSVYRLTPEAKPDTITLTGRVPNEYLRLKAASIAAAAVPDRKVINQIIAVNVPPDPSLTAAEVQRLTAVLNQQENVSIVTRYRGRKVTIEGIAPNPEDVQAIVQAFEQIPGVNRIVTTLNLQPDILDNRIFFESGSFVVNSEDAANKLMPIVNFLKRYPETSLKIVGHSDAVGNLFEKQQIAKKRAESVKSWLVNQGLAPQRLKTSGSIQTPPNVQPDAPLQYSRCVRFELLTSSSKS